MQFLPTAIFGRVFPRSSIFETAATLSSIQTAVELLKRLRNPQPGEDWDQVILDLQSALLTLESETLDLQAKYGALLRVKDEIEQRLAQMEDWEEKAARYELAEPVSGFFAYALKSEFHDTEPPHHLCTRCYDRHMKSILSVSDGPTTKLYRCAQCNIDRLARR